MDLFASLISGRVTPGPFFFPGKGPPKGIEGKKRGKAKKKQGKRGRREIHGRNEEESPQRHRRRGRAESKIQAKRKEGERDSPW
ncbi:MAG: hypothetical protein GX442_05815 [Candidatus Riflebacteria bacterium]|nr:hypothetical protein [Candidatus Riflebacteria bacterium]